MKTSLSAKSLGAIIPRIIYRYHVVLFTLVFIGGMALVIFLLNQTITSSTDLTTGDPVQSGEFDQSTIDRLDELDMNSGSGSSLDFPSNTRINPFVE